MKKILFPLIIKYKALNKFWWNRLFLVIFIALLVYIFSHFFLLGFEEFPYYYALAIGLVFTLTANYLLQLIYYKVILYIFLGSKLKEYESLKELDVDYSNKPIKRKLFNIIIFQKKFILVYVILIILIGIILVNYQTLSPCKILENETRSILEETYDIIYEETADYDNIYEELIIDSVVENSTDGLNSFQCLRELISRRFFKY